MTYNSTAVKIAFDCPAMAYVYAENANLLPLSPLGRIVGIYCNHSFVDVA